MDEQLIQRFFEKNCTPQEAQQVAVFLSRNPAILDKYLDKEEWNTVDPVQMDDEFWDDVWNEIGVNRNKTRSAWVGRLAIAASVIIILSAGFLFLTTPKKPDRLAIEESAPIEPIQRVRVNHTGQPVNVDLPDSSVVILSPGSVLTYQEPFASTKRDLQLEGKGRFKVKKDQHRPFTVYAGGLATTALGTEFTINTNTANTHTISVQLHTGKVVVKQTSHTARAWKQDVYLNPGEQLSYNPETILAAVAPIQDEKIKKSGRKTVDKKSLQQKNSNDLAFVNAPLTDVLTKLNRHFETEISYDSSEVASMNFTGSISREDSLAIVLKVIAQMNDLELTEEQGKFRLKKLY